LPKENLELLLVFDILFMLDRVFDLLVTFYKANGTMEANLADVIKYNISAKFFIEIFASFGPFLFDLEKLNSLIYALFKMPRYTRLFEIDN